ncbi:hypothetical protein CG09_0026 [Riemerella anatipestifer]|nr:hypothetical protein CG09_0026 [Riemerella anatipestifer]
MHNEFVYFFIILNGLHLRFSTYKTKKKNKSHFNEQYTLKTNERQ